MKIISIIILIVVFNIFNGCSNKTPKQKLNNLIGYWKVNIDDNVEYIFKKNGEVEYFENGYVYNFYLEDDKLIIKEKDHLISKYKIKLLTSDSLHIETLDGRIIHLVRSD